MPLHHYQTTFILSPELSKEQCKQAVGKVRALLQELEARIVHEEDLGLRELAYPITKHTKGIYHHIEFQAPAANVRRLEAHYRIHEQIVRFLTVRLDKHAVAYYAQQRATAQKLSEAPEGKAAGKAQAQAAPQAPTA